MTTVYKVLSIVEGTFVSSFAPPSLALTYQKDKETKPKVGLLFAFYDLESAKDFFTKSDGDAIWSAEAEVDEDTTKELTRHEIAKSRFMLEMPDVISRFWDEWFLPTHYYDASISTAPLGTVLCKSITLKERVG